MPTSTWDDEDRACLAIPRPSGEQFLRAVIGLNHALVTKLTIGKKLHRVGNVREPVNWEGLMDEGVKMTRQEYWLLCPDEEARQIKKAWEER